MLGVSLELIRDIGREFERGDCSHSGVVGRYLAHHIGHVSEKASVFIHLCGRKFISV